MFNALKKALGQQTHSTVTPASPHALTGHSQISALLMQIYKCRVLLDVRLPEQANHYTSALLGIYDEHGFIVMDGLNPTSGHRRLLDAKRLQVAGRLDGVDFSFSTRLIDVREKQGTAFYKMTLPEQMIYRQRRLDFRIGTLGRKFAFHALRGDSNAQILAGYLHDISRNGVGLILENGTMLEPGEQLASCIIALPDGKVSCTLEVCHCHQGTAPGTTRAGCRFTRIENAARVQIQRLISTLERDKARRLHGA